MSHRIYGKPPVRIAITVSICLLIFLFISVTAGTGQGENDEKLVAVVNGEKITKEELSERARIYRIVMALRSVPLFAEFIMETKEGEAALDRYREFVLDKLIREKIISQKANSFGITVTSDEINNRLQVIIEKTKEVDSKDELLERLKKDRRTLHDLKEEISHKLLKEKLKQRVVGDFSVSQKEIEEYYETNRDSFRSKDGEVKPLDEVRDHIREKLRKDREDELWKTWLDQAKKDSKIVKKLNG